MLSRFEVFMSNQRKALEHTMKDILRKINSPSSVSDSGKVNWCLVLDFNDEERYALKECCDRGYIEGVFCAVMVAGNITFDISHPRVTLEGQKFLYPYADWKFWVPALVSIIELIIIIIQFLFGSDGIL